MARKRTTIKLDPELEKMAKGFGGTKGLSLSDVIEVALRSYLPPAYGVQITGDPNDMKLEFVSGPTISKMKPNMSQPENAGVPSPNQKEDK